MGEPLGSPSNGGARGEEKRGWRLWQHESCKRSTGKNPRIRATSLNEQCQVLRVMRSVQGEV